MNTNKKKLLTLGLMEGRIVSVNDVENGKDCNCVCPSCYNKLVAKNNGKVKISHFAHLIIKDCPGAIESAIHLLCKQIFFNEKKIFIPTYLHFENEYKKREAILEYDFVLHFDKVEIEKRIDIGQDFIVADAIGYAKGKMLIIEFANTHFIDDEKKKKLKKLGMPCLEFAISTGSQDVIELTEQLQSAQLEPKWIVNKRGEAIAKAVRERLRLKQAEAYLKRRLAQDKRRQEQVEADERFRLRVDENEKKRLKKRAEDLKTAKAKGELVLSCPIKKQLRTAYDEWLDNLHPIIPKIRKAYHVSSIYDRLPDYIDIFINKEREFLIPENFVQLPEEEQTPWLQKLNAVEAYLNAKENKHLNFCGICKFYRGVSHEYTICKYCKEDSLEKIFDADNLDKVYNQVEKK